MESQYTAMAGTCLHNRSQLCGSMAMTQSACRIGKHKIQRQTSRTQQLTSSAPRIGAFWSLKTGKEVTTCGKKSRTSSNEVPRFLSHANPSFRWSPDACYNPDTSAIPTECSDPDWLRTDISETMKDVTRLYDRSLVKFDSNKTYTV